ncbi:MAG: hypothetical protein MUE85_05500 [Microscillaceae bacterium]|jgi:tetratricopeptide (TPR) repeat protein|nr:hypothetical protein [Microscillaceae bacterium]
MKKVFLVAWFFLATWQIATAQLLQDAAAQNMASQTLDKIYNFDFVGAKTLIAQIKVKYAKHPVVPFLNAYVVSWENLPLQKNQPEFTHYNQYLQLCLQYAHNLLKINKNDLEGIYFAMAAYSLLSLHEAESGDFLTSVSYGKNAYTYMKKGFDLTEKYADFHFTTGLYQYYAVQYPETHPIAKPFMAFFPGGDKKKGLEHLQIASQKSRFSKVESLIYLTSIYAKYEQNNYQAWLTAQQLVNQYPNNPFFWVRYCESLITLGRYAEAELYLSKFGQKNQTLYQSAFNLFRGQIQEKYYKNLNLAQTEYLKVLNVNKADKRYTKDFQAFAHAGLAHIAHEQGNAAKAKEYYKKVLKTAEYEGLKAEAKAYLKGGE